MFNEHRTIEIGIIFSKETFDKKDFCRIEIRDNGTGIEEIRKLKIFQRVYNKDKTISGLGLGLSLVKKIVDTYNGKIWVEDIVKGDHSKGSNFILLIPINSY
jgi:signal transduction histidine kinase